VRRRLALAAAALFATSCGMYETLDEHPCPPGGTDLTYADFAAPFFDRQCQSCHASDATDREGAPGEFAFDTHEQVKRHAERIYVRAAGPNDSMPPGPDDPERSERDKLADWLACGAP
jgi:uncharacterized membrane protein